MPRFFDYYPAPWPKGQPFALAIISGIKGSSPGRKRARRRSFISMAGFKARWAADAWKRKSRTAPAEPCSIRRRLLFDLVLDHDFGWDDGPDLRRQGVWIDSSSSRRAGGRDLAQTGRSPRDVELGREAGFHHLVADPVGAQDWLYQETIAPPCALWIAGSGPRCPGRCAAGAPARFQCECF